MAKPKSKKTDKKSTPKADAPKSKAEVKEVKEVKAPVVAETTVVEKTVVSGEEKPLKGFFARKYDANENVLTIFKSPRVWGALLGELVGTMLLVFIGCGSVSVLLMLAADTPTVSAFDIGIGTLGGLGDWLAVGVAFGLAVAVVIYALGGVSGAHINPAVSIALWSIKKFPAKDTVAYIIADEEAKFTQHDKNEAHPSLLLGERQKTFARRLFVHASTPNTEDNLFWRGYLDSDQRHYYIPCPHCGQYQTLKFTRETLVWDHPPGEPVTDAIVENTARYICPHCGGAWDDHQLKSSMTRGEWRAHNPDASPTRRGYHLSSLYSPDVSLGQFAVEFVRASRDQFAAQRLQNFWNSWLAEPYTRHTIRVDDSNIYALTGEHLRGYVPTGDYHYIIVTYDPGQTSTHWMATAIGPAGSMLVLDYGTILGITSDPSTGQLGIWDHYQSLSWPGPDGTRHTPAIGYIDSGDWTTQVYAECEKSGKILAPTKGSSAPYGSFAQTPVKSTPGLDLIVYSDHVLKRELYGEIINRRASTPEIAVSSWLDSPGHRDMILAERYHSAGIACWQGSDGITYWCMLFCR